jgi:hypothetical protein
MVMHGNSIMRLVTRAALAASVLFCAAFCPAADPPRMKRADAFLGIHFDFHAGDDCDRVRPAIALAARPARWSSYRPNGPRESPRCKHPARNFLWESGVTGVGSRFRVSRLPCG